MLPDSVNPRIKFNTSFAEWEAATAAGLDLWQWEQPGGYTKSFKAKVLAWHRAHNLVSAHTQAAANAKLKSKSKKGS